LYGVWADGEYAKVLSHTGKADGEIHRQSVPECLNGRADIKRT
jgi:hypothetical protein